MSAENWIRLAKMENPRRALALVEHFGNPDEIFQASIEEIASLEGFSSRIAERILQIASEPVEKELAALNKIGAQIVTYWDEDYPANLRQIF
ncbi:MAG: helix-hairpin-helix domain-containing protein, partial [Armatimonadota bacterium]|nr:helix-hairpin-helix domain-containing protein [Armatimonadota bacterium]